MNVLKILYQISCILAALAMTAFCVYKYLKNESVVSVNNKMFHETPDDVYSSFFICFFNLESGPFVDTNDIKKTDIRNMMWGEASSNQSLLGNVTYEDITIKMDIERIIYHILPNTFNKILSNTTEYFKTSTTS